MITAKKSLIISAIILTFSALTLTVLSGFQQAKATSASQDIVGAWEVTAVAPYAPHLFTFNSDGTMQSTNPTDVQLNPAAAHGGTNDSLGMGVWKEVTTNGQQYIEGTFEELNAFADNHQPTDTLSVSFKLKLTNDGDGFDGPAKATLGGATFDSHLTGTKRIVPDQATIDTL